MLTREYAIVAPERAGFAADVAEYLQRSPRQLPSRYLYDALGSALFDAICQLPWYRVTRAETALLHRHAAQIVSGLSRPLNVAELGGGNGEKLAVLLERAWGDVKFGEVAAACRVDFCFRIWSCGSRSQTMSFSIFARAFCFFALSVCLFAAPVRAQGPRSVAFGSLGFAGIGHADSEQGHAPLFGGGVGFYLTPVLAVEGDVHRARVSHVFDRDHHDFTETTLTGSLLYRSTPNARAHFIAAGGAGLQRAHTDVDDPPFRIDRTETIRLLHGRFGAEWDVSSRMAIRTEGVLWFGEGLDWVLGARMGVGYRF